MQIKQEEKEQNIIWENTRMSIFCERKALLIGRGLVKYEIHEFSAMDSISSQSIAL